MFDEVQTGHRADRGVVRAIRPSDGVAPDVVTLGEGARGRAADRRVHRPRRGSSSRPGEHASTFGGGPIPCRAALAVLDVIEDEDLLANCRDRGAQLTAGTPRGRPRRDRARRRPADRRGVRPAGGRRGGSRPDGAAGSWRPRPGPNVVRISPAAERDRPTGGGLPGGVPGGGRGRIEEATTMKRARQQALMRAGANPAPVEPARDPGAAFRARVRGDAVDDLARPRGARAGPDPRRGRPPPVRLAERHHGARRAPRGCGRCSPSSSSRWTPRGTSSC